jgi:hypothetical protein
VRTAAGGPNRLAPDVSSSVRCQHFLASHADVKVKQGGYSQAVNDEQRSGLSANYAAAEVAQDLVWTDAARWLSTAFAVIGAIVMALLKVTAAEPAAELGFSLLLTYKATAILVVAVVGGPVALACAHGERWRCLLLGYQLVVLVVLLDVGYLFQFVTLLAALGSALQPAVLTRVPYFGAEELIRRAEPLAIVFVTIVGFGQVQQLLATCDQSTAVGQRDFAIMTMLVRLGLPAGEVTAMELGDVDWRGGEIIVRGKGDRRDCLPLPVDVGRAVAAGLRRSRPTAECRRLFLRAVAPHRSDHGRSVHNHERRR